MVKNFLALDYTPEYKSQGILRAMFWCEYGVTTEILQRILLDILMVRGAEIKNEKMLLRLLQTFFSYLFNKDMERKGSDEYFKSVVNKSLDLLLNDGKGFFNLLEEISITENKEFYNWLTKK